MYDLLGRSVYHKSWLNLPAGEHVFPWQGANSSGLPLSSGRYFIVLESNAVTQLRAVTLLR